MLIQRKTAGILRIKHRQSLRFPGWLIAICALPQIALAADNPGAHEHGQARLQMALENSRIDLMFTSPAYNLAGFEHQARTGDEKKQLAEISDWLEKKPLINTEADACSVTASSVQLGVDSGAGSYDEHDHHEKKVEGHRDDEASHRDYKVTQQLICEGISSNDTLMSPLPERFPALEALTIEWVGPSGQGSAVVTPSARRFYLNE